MNWLGNILHKLDEQYQGNADPQIRSILCSFESEVKLALTNRAFRYVLSYFDYNELQKMELIDASEFNLLLSKEMRYDEQEHSSTKSLVKISTDGMDYYHFSVAYTVGWQGDYDIDAVYCKVKTMTEAERDELMKMLSY